MRVPLAFVKNGVEEAGHCLKKLQYERLDHPDYHLVAVFYEVLYPVTKLTSLCTIMIINWSMTVSINCVNRAKSDPLAIQQTVLTCRFAHYGFTYHKSFMNSGIICSRQDKYKT